jgi:nitrite reductase (NO-forming)
VALVGSFVLGAYTSQANVRGEGQPRGDLDAASFVLGTALTEAGFRWMGKDGSITQVENPPLIVKLGQTVSVEIVNEDGIEHDFAIPALGVGGKAIATKGERTSVTFVADKVGTFEYICKVAGHKEAGMWGTLVVEGPSAPSGPSPEPVVTLGPPQVTTVADIARKTTDLPLPITRTTTATLEVLLETREVVAELAQNVTYEFWTFNGTVPGPFIRVREGDTVVLSLQNSLDNKHVHSIDLHAVIGPGGGAVFTQVPVGETRTFSFKALRAGLYAYHCASPHIPTHIANGMYGLILVEPPEGLRPVDREFYVMQSEFYTTGTVGQTGHHKYDGAKARSEDPTYVVMNGRVGALTGEGALQADVGDEVRIYYGNIGPNLISSFHIIGAIFDRIYPEGSITTSPLRNVQTTLVPAGGATVVEFEVPVPGNFILVDHSIFRAIDKGAVGILVVQGEENPEIIRGEESAADSSGH